MVEYMSLNYNNSYYVHFVLIPILSKKILSFLIPIFIHLLLFFWEEIYPKQLQRVIALIRY